MTANPTATEHHPIDLRLLGPALSAWLATLAVLQFGWRTGLAMSVATALGAVVAVGSPLRPRAVVAAILAVVAGFALAAAWRMHAVDGHPLMTVPEGASIGAVVDVVDDPHRLDTAAPDGSGRVLVRATLREVSIAGRTTAVGGSVVVLAPAEGWVDLLPSQRVSLRAEVAPAQRRDLTVAALIAHGRPTTVGSPSWLQRAAGTVRARFADAVGRALPADEAALLPGLVVGDTSRVSPQVRADFRAAGLAHLLAVSGANVSIIFGAVLIAARAATLGPRPSVLLAALALAAFVVLARPSPSVLRAAVMGAIGLLALVTSRRKQAMPALCTAVIVLLALRPALAFDAGFALSVVATAGLILLAPSWADWLQARGSPRPVAEAVAVAAAAFAVTLPVVVAVTGTVSLVSIAANLLVAAVIAPLTVIGVLAAVAAAAWSPAGEWIAHLAAPGLWWLLFVARRAAALPGATVAVPPGAVPGALAAVVVAGGVIALRSRRLRAVAAAIGVGLAVVLIPARIDPPGWPPPDWSLVACDVGQGDGLVLATGAGGAVVVDVGPDGSGMPACLRRLGIQRVDLLVLTHLHADHIGGLRAVLRAKPVAAVAVGPMRRPGEVFDGIARATAAAHVPLVALQPGDQLRFPNLTLHALGPLLPAPTADADADDAANDQSIVLAADTRAGRVLLTGDVEIPAQEALLRAGADLRADVLKVPHHGSRTTSPAFLAAVRPRVAVISVGADNTFGHPAAELLGWLDRLGSTVARTDLDGDIAIAGAREQPRLMLSDPRPRIEP
ncbi:MAG TPA: DNA internalization-related competence protein ComEC/Rec2 [Aldersonia sp.]